MLMVGVFAQSPAIVEGTVVDQTTMQPVPNISVFITEINGNYIDTAVTDNQGPLCRYYNSIYQSGWF